MKVAAFLLCTLALGFAESIPPNSGRVVGGQIATDGQFPYIISLKKDDSHICGGTILDETTILCSAHCIDGSNASSLSISAGTTKLNEDGQTADVECYKIHENYDDVADKGDLAIIKLSSPLQLNEKVQPVELGRRNIGANDDVTLLGWGRTESKESFINDLHFIKLKTISAEKCRKQYSDENIEINANDSEAFCTLNKDGKGACHGDSGAPLVDSKGKLVGVASWGVRPCGLKYPNVFTRVHSFLDWIDGTSCY